MKNVLIEASWDEGLTLLTINYSRLWDLLESSDSPESAQSAAALNRALNSLYVKPEPGPFAESTEASQPNVSIMTVFLFSPYVGCSSLVFFADYLTAFAKPSR